jgi:hypothetical protein
VVELWCVFLSQDGGGHSGTISIPQVLILRMLNSIPDCNYTPTAGFCPDVVQPVLGMEVQLSDGSAATL